MKIFAILAGASLIIASSPNQTPYSDFGSDSISPLQLDSVSTPPQEEFVPSAGPSVSLPVPPSVEQAGPAIHLEEDQYQSQQRPRIRARRRMARDLSPIDTSVIPERARRMFSSSSASQQVQPNQTMSEPMEFTLPQAGPSTFHSTTATYFDLPMASSSSSQQQAPEQPLPSSEYNPTESPLVCPGAPMIRNRRNNRRSYYDDEYYRAMCSAVASSSLNFRDQRDSRTLPSPTMDAQMPPPPPPVPTERDISRVHNRFQSYQFMRDSGLVGLGISMPSSSTNPPPPMPLPMGPPSSNAPIESEDIPFVPFRLDLQPRQGQASSSANAPPRPETPNFNVILSITNPVENVEEDEDMDVEYDYEDAEDY
ncbi:hypothetical protein O9G_005280 [Rozella allomycis CSF55]|uniref:Uncharacterized protein n=1 Tax=Rozella allomycis (strain CSF55) TaxID=988480 RepID=A0A075AYQ3_ROZAC|nr:hypothetical protein O9G_005280 [Rozella allomycis CSF55]|eukprot:EPZ35445.1 hypothetical protein O9G_005280 [Rozella allomycis CSF55]